MGSGDNRPGANQATSGAPSLLIGISHTGFTVADIERSIVFYRDLLGMTLVSRQEGQRPYLATITGFPDVYLKTAFLKAAPEAEHVLELLEYTSHPEQPTPRATNLPGNGHICLRVRDLQGLYERLVQHEVTFISPPTFIDTGVNRGTLACYLRDPDGFTIELTQPPGVDAQTLI